MVPRPNWEAERLARALWNAVAPLSSCFEAMAAAAPVANATQSPGWPQFQAVIGSIFNQWTALHLAIDQQWGGGSSSEKGERLFQDTLAFFAQSTPQDPVYADELSDFFEDAMTERFA